MSDASDMDGEVLVEFSVRGKPQPRGSKQPFVIYSDRKNKVPARRADGSILVNMTDDNAESKAWMETVARHARAAWRGAPIEGAGLDVVCVFFLERPEGHHGTGRNRRLVSDNAPARPHVRPDLDKLARGTLDAVTGIVWKDDQQIVGLSLDKRYGVARGPQDPGLGVVIKVARTPQQRASDLPIDLRERWIPPGDDAPAAEDSLLAA